MGVSLSAIHLTESNLVSTSARDHFRKVHQLTGVSSSEKLMVEHFRVYIKQIRVWEMGVRKWARNPSLHVTVARDALINNFPLSAEFPGRASQSEWRPDLCTHLQIQECRRLGTLLGGTSNRGTVPLIAPPPPPGPPPSPSSAGSRSSGTWRLLILEVHTPLPVVASRHQNTSSSRPTSSRITRQPDITDPRASTELEGDFTHTRIFHADTSALVKAASLRICLRDRDILLYPPAIRKLAFTVTNRDGETCALWPKDSRNTLSAKQCTSQGTTLIAKPCVHEEMLEISDREKTDQSPLINWPNCLKAIDQFVLHPRSRSDFWHLGHKDQATLHSKLSLMFIER